MKKNKKINASFEMKRKNTLLYIIVRIMTYQTNYSFFVHIRDCVYCSLYVYIFISFTEFFFLFFCGLVLLYLPVRRQSSTDRMGFQRCYYLFFSGRCIRIFRRLGRSLSTRQDAHAGLVFIFKFIFILLPFIFNKKKKLKSTEEKINISYKT